MVDTLVLYNIELFILGVKTIVHTRVIFLFENTDR